MFEIKQYTVDNQQEWDAFIEESKNGTFMLKRGYMDYHADRFVDSSLMLYRKNKLWAVMPANTDGHTLYSHQGLTYGGLIMSERCTGADVVVAFKEICEWAKSKGFERIVYKVIPRIYSTLPSEEDLYALFRSGARLTARGLSSCIDLSRLLKWRQTRRTALNAAFANGVTVEKTKDITDFWAVLEANLQATHGLRPVHTLGEMQLLMSRFPNNITLYQARKDGKVIGGILLYITKQVTHSQYISASEEGKRVGAVDIIMRTILNNCTTRYFDFGISTEQGGTVLNEGLLFQKEGFGARGVCYDIYEIKALPQPSPEGRESV